MPRSSSWPSTSLLVAGLLGAACFAPEAQACGNYGRPGRGLSHAQRHGDNIFSVFHERQRAPHGQQPHALLKTDDRGAAKAAPPTPTPPMPMPTTRCASHTDCAARQYCRQALGGPVCSDCVDYRNHRCQDWQDSIDGRCTVCDADDGRPRRHESSQPQQQPEQQQHQQQQQQYSEPHQHQRGQHEPHHHHDVGGQAGQHNTRSGGGQHQHGGGYGSGVRYFFGHLFWMFFMTSLVIFSTNCFFYFMSFMASSIMWAVGCGTSPCCSAPPAAAAVYAYDEDAALQAALTASLLTSGATAVTSEQPPPQQQQQRQQSCGERSVQGNSSSGGCCIGRCLGRLFMIPVFMMSLCCPLCMFISAAFLFSRCRGGCGGGSGLGGGTLGGCEGSGAVNRSEAHV